MAIITAAQVRDHFAKLPAAATAEDTILNTLVTRADALLAQWCGYPRNDAGIYTFEDTACTLYIDGPDVAQPRKLKLGFHPIASLTSVATDTVGDWTWSTTITSSDYVLDGVKGHLWLKPTSTYAWQEGPRANKVVALVGFTAAPNDLVALVAMQVVHLLQLRNTQGLTNLSAAGQSAQKPGNPATGGSDFLIPPVVQAGLTPYIVWESRCG